MSSDYQSLNYVKRERWNSYWYQLQAVLSCQPTTVLEVGIGNGTVSDFLRRAGLKIMTCDHNPALRPDVLADVLRLPFAQEEFSVVLCAEVLEHLPFEQFIPALRELRRVSQRFAVITLPRWGHHFSLEIKLPRWGRRRWQVKISWPPLSHRYNGQHYWEIGKRGYPLALIEKQINSAGWQIKRSELIFDNPYHQLFVLEKYGN
jgi:SAM-dependent methyltransferase